MQSNDMNKNSFNIASSESAQANFERVASKLEAALAAHDKQVKTLMAQYQADGVSEQHQANEQKWSTNADDVHGIIRAVRGSLQKSDDHANTALNKARSAVEAV